MKQHITILALLVLTLTQKIIACECNSTGNFLTIAPTTGMVALVKVIKNLSIINRYGVQTAQELEIFQVYKGTETRDTISFWGSTGKDCRPLISDFIVG